MTGTRSPARPRTPNGSGLIAHAGKFLAVGGVGFLIDLVIFNALSLGLAGEGPWSTPLGAKTISVCVAIVANWIGNSAWTFRERRRANRRREFAEFVAASLLGLGASLLVLWLSHDVFGWTSLGADNIANLVGLGLGTAIRFVLYRWWVFAPGRGTAAPAPGPAPETPGEPA